MPREVTPQADQHAQSPKLLAEQPDSAYGLQGNWDDNLDFEDMSRGEYNRLRNKHDPHYSDEAAEAWDEANHEALDNDEDVYTPHTSPHSPGPGYNWGPPPPEHHDPGFQEVEDDPYPYA